MSTKEFKDRVSPKSSDDKDLEKKNQPLPVYEEEDEWDEWYDECFIENEKKKIRTMRCASGVIYKL